VVAVAINIAVIVVVVSSSTSPLLPSRIEKWWMDTKDERRYDAVGMRVEVNSSQIHISISSPDHY